MDVVSYKPIGVIRSPFTKPRGMPIQPAAARGVEGSVEILPGLAEGLQDLDGFSHVILIYHLHVSHGYSLRVRPFLDKVQRGVFATRAPHRPNPIGLSVVELMEVEGATLRVRNLDVVDGTPLLDLKPFVPEFDTGRPVRLGWLEGKLQELADSVADDRFES